MKKTTRPIDTHRVVKFILAHAELLLPEEFVFSPSDLHAAMKKLKDNLTEEAVGQRILSDLVFADPDTNPHSGLLDSIKSSMWAAEVGLIELRPGGERDRVRCSFNAYWAGRVRARLQTKLNANDVALLEPLVPLFVKHLQEVVALRGKP